MFSSETISRDMSRNSAFLLPNPTNHSSFKHGSVDGQFLKSRDSIGSELFMSQNQLQQHDNSQQSCGLARYRSAPSSFFAALLDSTTDSSSSVDESEALFSALMDGPRDLSQKSGYNMKQEAGVGSEVRPGQSGLVNGQMGYEGAVTGGGGAGSYNVNGNGNGSSLLRQSSSPAGFLNGYGIMGEVGNYRIHNHPNATSSSSGAMNNHMNFSSAPSSSLGFMPSIPENVHESMATRNPETGPLIRASSANARDFDSVFPQESWNDTTFNTLKRSREDDVKMFFNFNDNKNGESRKTHHGLIHHMSLPKTSSELAEVEKFLQFQPDTVTCQIRAKRGCATHPRSIAERMRRTKISEKMKKLQDLFPNLDKQTSTADMLDMAAQFIKGLQEQVDMLTETRAKCVCSHKPHQPSPKS